MNPSKFYLIIVVFFFFSKIIACDCPLAKTPIKIAYKKSNEVINGKIISIITLPIILNEGKWIINPDSAYEAISIYKTTIDLVTIKVNSNYKNTRKKDLMQIYTLSGLGSCGYKFSIDMDYIIYAENAYYYFTNEENRTSVLFVERCGRTGIYNFAEDKNLRKLKARYSR